MSLFKRCTTILGLALAIQVSAQDAAPSKGIETVAIQSTAICDMCEKTIETEMIYEKGVKKVDVDLETAKVHVTFDTRKTNADNLRTALTKLGYSADGNAGDPAAFAKLPQCCQKEGCGKLPVTP